MCRLLANWLFDVSIMAIIPHFSQSSTIGVIAKAVKSSAIARLIRNIASYLV